MAKNTTRKSLAVAAAFSLGLTGLVASPAQAADGIKLDANTGTVLAMPITETLTLNAALVPTLPAANIAQLKYKIVHDGTYNLKAVSTSAGGAVTAYTNDDDATYQTTAGVDNNIDAEDDNGQKYVVANINTSTVVTPNAPTAAAANTLALSVDATLKAGSTAVGLAPSKTVATRTATVTAWIDSDLDGVVDSDEVQKTVTVSFLKYSEMSSSVTITAPVEGDTTVTAKLAFTNVNNEQLTANEVGVYVTAGDGTALDADESKVVKSAVAWSATNSFKYTTSAVAALAKNTAVKVQPLFKGTQISTLDNTADVAEKVGTAVIANVATRAAGSIVVDTVDSATTAVATAGGTVTADVALNSTFAVKAIVKDTQSTPAVLPGASVTAKITTDATLSGTAGSVVSIAVGGTTYTDGTKLPGATGVDKIALTTDANGEVSLTITTAGFSNGEDVVVEFTVENRTATITANNATKTYSSYVVGALDGVSTTSGSATLQFAVRDQFGGRPANGTYKVANDWISSNQTTASTAAGTETSVSVVNGDAVMTVTSNGSGTGTEVFDFDLKTLAADGSYSATASIIDNFEIHHVASAAVGTVTVTDGDNSVVTQNATTKVYTDALVAGNNGSGELLVADVFSHNGLTDVTAAPDASSVNGAEITGNLKTAASATVAATAVPGATVTLTAPGIMFNYTADGSIEIYSVGSITVPTDKSGNFTVSAFSNLAGKHTVTLSSGSGSATLVLDKFDAADDNAGTSLVIDAPDYVPAGSTVIATATVTDKYGNVINTVSTTDATNDAADELLGDFAMSYTGPGLQVGTTPTETDANGQAKVSYFLGSNDTGTITITAKYDANGDLDYADTGDLVVTKTITIGTPAVATWTKNLGSGEVKMYAKNIVGAGKVQFMLNGEEIAWVNATSSANSKLRSANGFYYLVRTVELVEGQKNVLEIYVDGVRTTRTAYTY